MGKGGNDKRVIINKREHFLYNDLGIMAENPIQYLYRRSFISLEELKELEAEIMQLI